MTANVIAEDLEGTPEVVDAEAILRASARQPELVLPVDVDERADIDAVVTGVAQRVSRNCAQALGSPLPTVPVEVGIARTKQRRQRSVTL